MTAPSSGRGPAMAPAPSQQQAAVPRTGYSGSTGQQPLPVPPTSSGTSTHDRAAIERERELKKQKEKFLIFTRYGNCIFGHGLT
jgi:hypothetical protein